MHVHCLQNKVSVVQQTSTLFFFYIMNTDNVAHIYTRTGQLTLLVYVYVSLLNSQIPPGHSILITECSNQESQTYCRFIMLAC